MRASPWDFSNQVLYDVCRAHPAHDDEKVVIAKVLLIGRAYSAAVERRKNKKQGADTDSFYLETVGPMLRKSKIDRWIAEARASRPGTRPALATMVKIHSLTTDLFCSISCLEKRALASEYCTSTCPACSTSTTPAPPKQFASSPLNSRDLHAQCGDDEYRKFAERCQHLRDLCAKRFSLELRRAIDNLLQASPSAEIEPVIAS
jgi:hypothetical protein